MRGLGRRVGQVLAQFFTLLLCCKLLCRTWGHAPQAAAGCVGSRQAQRADASLASWRAPAGRAVPGAQAGGWAATRPAVVEELQRELDKLRKLVAQQEGERASGLWGYISGLWGYISGLWGYISGL